MPRNSNRETFERTVVADKDGAFLRQWLAACEEAEQLWQACENNDVTGRNEQTNALTLWMVPRLDLAAYNLVSHLIARPETTITLRSTFDPDISSDDINDDEFNLLVAVGLLQTDTRGRYHLAVPQFDAAGFKAAVGRESRRRSDEFDSYCE
jgi:hypothetical protein